MDNKVKIILNNQSLEVNAIRFFKKENQVYFVYSLFEKDENQYIKLYVTKIYNQSGQLIGVGINDENEWKIVKLEIQDIIRANRENLQPNIIDLDTIILNNIKINDYRAFKLLEQSINLLERRLAAKLGNDNYEQLYLNEQQKNVYLLNEIKKLNNKFNELKNDFDKVINHIETNKD